MAIPSVQELEKKYTDIYTKEYRSSQSVDNGIPWYIQQDIRKRATAAAKAERNRLVEEARLRKEDIAKDTGIKELLSFTKEDDTKLLFFDARLYRHLTLTPNGKTQNFSDYHYPYMEWDTYVTDLYETPQSVTNAIKETEDDGASDYATAKAALEDRQKYIEKTIESEKDKFTASRAFVHPYALVTLAGASGHSDVTSKHYTYDEYNKRKFYEIDGDNTYAGNYSKNPTTTTLIRWGNESEKGKTPYSFQDFVFCKWWNKIENNRLITLRRYSAPVTDDINFSDYDLEENTDGEVTYTAKDGSTKKMSGVERSSPWVPLVTAVTYFGKETGNELSKILAFTAKYNWKELTAEKDPINVSSTQNDSGENLVSDSFSAISSGLGTIAKFIGTFGEIQNGKTMNLDAATGVPPDPYKQGPYENRILGPINVITKTYKRERGLEFKQDGLTITFDYIARPIAGVNNKAILLDLLSNMLVMTYSSGSWFGGMWRYNVEGNPALFPWRYGDVMNKLHRGELFGKDGAIRSLADNVFRDGSSLMSSFLPDVTKMVTGLFDGVSDLVGSLFTGGDKDTNGDGKSDKEEKQEAGIKALNDALNGTGTGRTIQKLIAAKAIKGTSIPYLKNAKALLTGEPVGDWHLTIGNPLNPIAMIGNLIIDNTAFEFYDELGPDDFPIGFKVKITLKHGLGRDRDAIESMFNRGKGRIYTLPRGFRSSADRETRVDNYTGTGDASDGNRQGYEEISQTYYGGGSRGVMATESSNLENKGTFYSGYSKMKNAVALNPNVSKEKQYTIPHYFVNPWQMAYNL